MKKTYTKPYIVVESFQLDAAIAASCSSEGKLALNHGMDICTSIEEAPGLAFFGLPCEAGGGHNVIDPSDGDSNNTICYHGPIYADLFMNS